MSDARPPARAAEDVLEARLQVGRFLRGPLLTLAVALRVLFWSLVTAEWAGDWVAPAWVVVSLRGSGKEVGRIPAGRDDGAGEHLLAAVQASLAEKTLAEFLQAWHLPAPRTDDV